MLDELQIKRILNLNEQLSKDIGKLQIEINMLEADLRGKDNEINDLKTRIEYLERFKPKTEETLTKQG